MLWIRKSVWKSYILFFRKHLELPVACEICGGGKLAAPLEIRAWMLIHRLPTPVPFLAFYGLLPMDQSCSTASTTPVSSPGGTSSVERLWPLFWHLWIHLPGRKEWALRVNVWTLSSLLLGCSVIWSSGDPEGVCGDHTRDMAWNALVATSQTCHGMSIQLRDVPRSSVLHTCFLLLLLFWGLPVFLWEISFPSEIDPILPKFLLFLCFL